MFRSENAMPDPVSLDRFDRAILALLQRDNSTPQRVIAEAVNLSAPAVQRRIRRLQDSGVIRANVALLDPDSVGLPLTLVVEVRMVGDCRDRVGAFRRRVEAEDAVQQCYDVTGEADYVLIVSVASMRDYEALTERLFGGDDNVQRFRTQVVLKRIKVGMALPLGAS